MENKKILKNDIVVDSIIKFCIWNPRIAAIIILLLLTSITSFFFKGTFVDESCGCANGVMISSVVGVVVYSITILLLSYYTKLGEELFDETDYRKSTMQTRLYREINNIS